MNILVSACLLGENCKYNGGNNLNKKLLKFIEGHNVIPVCPEVAGGLPTPRTPCEIINGNVKNKDGKSFDCEYRKGADLCLNIAMMNHIDLAILQSRSPSCGVNQIYDGTFTKNKINEHGIFATLLIENGYKVIDVEDI